MRALWLPLFLIPGVAGAQFDARYAGIYRTIVRDAKTGADGYRNTPPSQMRVLRLDAKGKWSWRDFMTGFDGTWTSKGSDLFLKVVNGPQGTLPRPHVMRIRASKDRKTLTVLEKSNGFTIRMVWDPTIEKRLRDRYRQATGG